MEKPCSDWPKFFDNAPELTADVIMEALKGKVQQARDEMLEGAKNWSQEFRRAFQRKLKAENLYSGTVDGIPGQGTRKAIEAIPNDNS